MPSFRYTAIGPGGELQAGLMDAESAREVVLQLQKRGSLPVQAQAAEAGGIGRFLSFGLGRAEHLRTEEVADLVRELATMLGAGQDLDRALRYAQETAPNKRVLKVATGLRDAVRDGASLSAALARYPGSFSKMHLGLVRAGEAGGKLAATLARMAELMDRQRSLRATVKSAMVYPSLLLLAALGSVALLLTQVLPQFVQMFDQSGAKLPGSTQFLIDAGAAFSNHWPHALVGLLVLLAAGRALLRQPAPALLLDHCLLRMPLIGGLAREVLGARLTRVLGTLLVNGVPLMTALDVTAAAIGNRAAASVVQRASTSARAGGRLTQAVADSGIFPPRTVHLLRLGEENAQLGPMSLRAAEIHEETCRLGTQRLVALLVPVITIAMGGLIAGIVASLMAAMLSLNDLAGS